MKEVKCDLGKNGKDFNGILSRQRMRAEKDTKKEKIQHIQMHMVYLHVAQENVLHDAEKNLNPACSLAFSGLLTLWDKWGLLAPLLTKSISSEAQNTEEQLESYNFIPKQGNSRTRMRALIMETNKPGEGTESVWWHLRINSLK